MSAPDPLEALRALGSTDDEVATTLREKGIKGWRGYTDACPLAQFLRAEGFALVNVTDTSFDVDDYHAALPEGARSFVASFDGSLYPDLDMDEADEDEVTP